MAGEHKCLHEQLIGKLKAHLDEGKMWRIAMLGNIFVLLIQLLSFSYFYGRLSEKVEGHNTFVKRLEGIMMTAYAAPIAQKRNSNNP